MHIGKIGKWIPSNIFLKGTASSVLSLCLLFSPLLLSFKITDYNEKFVVSDKSLSLKAPAISIDQKQPRRGFLKNKYSDNFKQNP